MIFPVTFPVTSGTNRTKIAPCEVNRMVNKYIPCCSVTAASRCALATYGDFVPAFVRAGGGWFHSKAKSTKARIRHVFAAFSGFPVTFQGRNKNAPRVRSASGHGLSRLSARMHCKISSPRKRST